MDRNKILTFASCLTISYIFLPIVFRNIPIPGIGAIIYGFFLASFVLIRPQLFLTKELFIFYFFLLLYFLLSPSTGPRSVWFEYRGLNILFGIVLYTYYFKYTSRISDLKTIFWFSFIVIVIGSITTYYGLSTFPMASRELASSVAGSIEKTNFYKSIGILGYGYSSAIAYFVPLPIIFYRYHQKISYKLLFLLILTLVTLTMIKTQYTGQSAMFAGVFVLSFVGEQKYQKYKYFLILILIVIIFLPQNIYSQFFSVIASFIPEETLKSRIMDLSETLLYDNINDAQTTHVGSRYQRIPFLWSEIKKSPLIGGGLDTGHVFWLDHLALFGVIGTIPWVLLLRNNYRIVKKITKNSFYYYQAAFIMFILLGFMKGSGSKEQILVLFFILPLGLHLYDKKAFSKKK